jgi:hypothetical protein
LVGVGSAALALTVAAGGCGDKHGPFGNLKAPDCDQGQCGPPPDMTVDNGGPFGNLKGPPVDMLESD